ncbi:MAG: hypothetical protein EAY75_08685 [Bacteroidetes bacterium]|nr:MAG: hypothetical protein EAY75_08685 [Bacteroidota bacterium]
MDFNDTGVNMMYNFEPSYQQWKLSAETKLINGLLVQKAIFINWQGVLSAEGWFYTALSIAVGPGMMVGVPGLLVEGYDFLSKRSFVLEEYDSGCTITDADFWFPEFSESFIQKVLKNRYPK